MTNKLFVKEKKDIKYCPLISNILPMPNPITRELELNTIFTNCQKEKCAFWKDSFTGEVETSCRMILSMEATIQNAANQHDPAESRK